MCLCAWASFCPLCRKTNFWTLWQWKAFQSRVYSAWAKKKKKFHTLIFYSTALSFNYGAQVGGHFMCENDSSCSSLSPILLPSGKKKPHRFDNLIIQYIQVINTFRSSPLKNVTIKNCVVSHSSSYSMSSVSESVPTLVPDPRYWVTEMGPNVVFCSCPLQSYAFLYSALWRCFSA